MVLEGETRITTDLTTEEVMDIQTEEMTGMILVTDILLVAVVVVVGTMAGEEAHRPTRGVMAMIIAVAAAVMADQLTMGLRPTEGTKDLVPVITTTGSRRAVEAVEASTITVASSQFSYHFFLRADKITLPFPPSQ